MTNLHLLRIDPRSTLAVLLQSAPAEHHPVRITLIVVGITLAVLAIVSGINYLRQRRQQATIQADGLVLYAQVLSAGKVGGWLKHLAMYDLALRIQEPNQAPREVKLRSRMPPGQTVKPGMTLIVVVDPKKPDHVYPATADAAKRVTITGSRQEKKLMQAQLKHPRRFHQRTQTGYMPPINKIR